MTRNYYPQTDWDKPPTLTVREMIARLQALPPDASVLVQSPNYGSFGPNSFYSVEKIEKVTLPRKEYRQEPGWKCDEETGIPEFQELDIQVAHEWTGVVIS